MQFKTNCYDLGKDGLLPYLNIMVNMSLLRNVGFQENPSEDTARNYVICKDCGTIMSLFIEI